MKISIACIAYRNGKILIAHRVNVGQMGGRWEFPGGKVDEGETDEIALVREMQEEFSITVKVIEPVTEAVFTHNGSERALHAYLIEVPHDGLEKPYVLTEHTEYKWVSIDEIPQDNFVDSDLLIYPEVKAFLNNRFPEK